MRLLFVSTALSCILFCSCSSTPELASSWHRAQQNEPSPSYHYFEKEKIGTTVTNDSTRLHITIKTIDHETGMKIIHGGMTIWFDSTGGDKKIFGIHFPIGLEAGGIAPPTHSRGSHEEPNPSNDFSLYETRMQAMLQNAEVIGPGPLDKAQLSRSKLAEARDIHLTISDTLSSLTYELDVPITYIAAFRSLSSANDPMGIGLITGDMRHAMMGRPSGEGPPGGGMGMPPGGGGGIGGRGGSGGGGGFGGRGGGMRGGEKGNAEPIELWMKLTLAPRP